MQDAELKHTPKRGAVCSFVLASNRYEGLVLRGHHLVAPGQGLRGVTVEGPRGAGGRPAEAGRWAGPEGQARSKIQIVAEHAVFKPQKKNDVDGKDGETADGQASEEAELKEAASF